MEHKLHIAGDVTHLVNGNVHEAPQLSSVVTLNVLGDNKKVETLTQLQRRTIADLIDQLCAKTGEERLALYRIILTDFGATKMKFMPREKYPQVKAQINQWLAEAKQGNEALEKDPTPILEKESHSSPPEAPAPVAVSPIICYTCVEKDIGYMRLQRNNRGLWVLIILLATICGWSLYKMPVPAAPEQVADNTTCFFEGKAYSTGGTIRVDGGLVKECIYDATTRKSFWSKPR